MVTPELRQRLIDITNEMQADLQADVEEFEGAPFTGAVVADYLGRLGGTLSALAGVVRATLEDER